jgi:hypothetical protein
MQREGHDAWGRKPILRGTKTMKQFIKAVAVATVIMGGFSSAAYAHDSPITWHDGGGYGWLGHNGTNYTNIWQCDTQVDGHRVRQHAYTDWGAIVVSDQWAPSGGCAVYVHPAHPSAFRYTRTCIENEGCTGWGSSGH